MSNRFTEKAEKALNRSVSLAEELGHTYIGTEHLLLSIIEDELTTASFILKKHGIKFEKIEKAIKDYSGTGTKSTLSSRDITPKGRRILESSYEYAAKFSGGTIGTEHILSAILDERDCVAVKLIRSLGKDISPIKDDLLSLGKIKEGASLKINNNTNIPNLKQHGKNMTELARNGEFDPVIGRESETERIIRVLSRKNKNNPCLVGEAGVGKTAIIEGLATRIAKGEVPEALKDKEIISVDLTSMVAGSKYRGDFEERIKNIINEATKNKSIILFIDEIHTIVGAGAAEGAIDAANILKPQLSRADIQIIGATTYSEYYKYIAKDPALERRFQPIHIKEPSIDETVSMLLGLKSKYEAFHKINIPNEAIELAVKLSVRYISDRFLPDKAIDVIDEACAFVNSKNNKLDTKIKLLDEKLNEVLKQKEEAIINQNFEVAFLLKSKEDKLEKEKEAARSQEENVINPSLKIGDIKQVVSEISGVPANEVNDKTDYIKLEDSLNNAILGQKKAVSTLVSAIKRSDSGLSDATRPKGTFLFVGPSGVGKTGLAQELSKLIFNDENAFLRFDMSEFSEKHSVSKLIGSPPGYQGHDEGGALTEAVRKRPYSLVLFDEIEKADKEILNLFLQIADNGFLTDSQGRRINFRNTYIIMTTNVGGGNIRSKASVGFMSENEKNNVISENLKLYFKEEFINRFDEIVSFNQLNVRDLSLIIENRLTKLKEKLKEKCINFDYDTEITDFIAEESFKEKMGARPAIRKISYYIENSISDLYINGIKDIYARIFDGRLIVEEKFPVTVK
jgi:ATP-dependent Clp protease ATP-binding subunit ClpC